MNDGFIARNRFGLGARAGEPPPADARGWLADQRATPAEGLLAFRRELGDARRRTTIVVMTEFGRAGR